MNNVVCVDFDGVIASRYDVQEPEIGRPIPGVRFFLEELQNRGYKIIILTSRLSSVFCATEQETLATKKLLIDWMYAHKMPFSDFWIGQGKPPAVAYIDNRGLNCDVEQNPERYREVLGSELLS